MNTVLRVNMKTLTCTREPMPENLRGLGGRGLSSSLVAREVPPACDPLSSENKLILAPGMLSGTVCPNSGRLSIGGKSPLTGGIKESNVGGTAAAKLARLGIEALIVEGIPAAGARFVLRLKKDSAELLPANDLSGTGTYALTRTLRERFGERAAVVCIGPAGERLLRSASIQVTDTAGNPCRAAGRGGLGALMGSKGLKAIVVDDTAGQSPAIADPELFSAGRKKVADAIKNHPFTGQAMPALGTAMVTGPMNAIGAFPALNARVGTYDKWEKLSGEALAELIAARGGQTGHAGCTTCIIRCSNVFLDDRKHYVTSGLEYETIWAFGGMCDIPDLDAIARFDHLCDDLGLDTMNTGCALAVAMEARIIPFGNAAAALDLVRQVGTGTDIGSLIGDGPAAVGKRYGVARVPVVKHQSIAGYDPRAVQGMGVTYATCPMGADHTAGWTVGACLESMGGTLDPLSPNGQVECSQQVQIHTAAADCTGLCQFTGFPLSDVPEGGQGLLDMINAKYGTSHGPEYMTELGKRVLRIERDFNLKAGLGPRDDRLPGFFYTEPLPPHNKTFLVNNEDMDRVFDF